MTRHTVAALSYLNWQLKSWPSLVRRCFSPAGYQGFTKGSKSLKSSGSIINFFSKAALTCSTSDSWSSSVGWTQFRTPLIMTDYFLACWKGLALGLFELSKFKEIADPIDFWLCMLKSPSAFIRTSSEFLCSRELANGSSSITMESWRILSSVSTRFYDEVLGFRCLQVIILINLLSTTQ